MAPLANLSFEITEKCLITDLFGLEDFLISTGYNLPLFLQCSVDIHIKTQLF